MLALASAFVAIPALGANREAKEKAARTACLAGDYAKGVTLLSELFVETKNPNWIFNSGRCFEQNARFQEAISRFQEYKRISDLEEPGASVAHARICGGPGAIRSRGYPRPEAGGHTLYGRAR
jgi:hypothetical protein